MSHLPRPRPTLVVKVCLTHALQGVRLQAPWIRNWSLPTSLIQAGVSLHVGTGPPSPWVQPGSLP